MIRKDVISEIRSIVEEMKADYHYRLYLRLLTESEQKDRMDADEGDWITVGGTHVLLGEGGVAQSGGKLKGMTFANAKSEEKAPKPSKKQTVQEAREAYKKLSPDERREYLLSIGKPSPFMEKFFREHPEKVDTNMETYFKNWEEGFGEVVPVPESSQQVASPSSGQPESQASEISEPERAQAGHRPNAEQIRNDYRLQEATIAKECGVGPKEASDMYDVLCGYLGAMSFTDIRLAQQVTSQEEYEEKSGMMSLSYEEAKDCADKISAYIDKAPVWNGGTLYRDIVVSADEAQQIADAARSGETLTQKGFSSWTSDKIEGKAPSRLGTHVVFVTPGTKQGTSVVHLSPTDEKEVLISGRATWKASKVYEENGSIIIECDEQ